MASAQPSMFIPNSWPIPKHPEDAILRIDRLRGRSVYAGGLDQLLYFLQRLFAVADRFVHPGSVVGTDPRGFEATQPASFVDVAVHVLGRSEEVGRLLADGFELESQFEDLDG